MDGSGGSSSGGSQHHPYATRYANPTILGPPPSGRRDGLAGPSTTIPSVVQSTPPSFDAINKPDRPRISARTSSHGPSFASSSNPSLPTAMGISSPLLSSSDNNSSSPHSGGQPTRISLFAHSSDRSPGRANIGSIPASPNSLVLSDPASPAGDGQMYAPGSTTGGASGSSANGRSRDFLVPLGSTGARQKMSIMRPDQKRSPISPSRSAFEGERPQILNDRLSSTLSSSSSRPESLSSYPMQKPSSSSKFPTSMSLNAIQRKSNKAELPSASKSSSSLAQQTASMVATPPRPARSHNRQSSATMVSPALSPAASISRSAMAADRDASSTSTGPEELNDSLPGSSSRSSHLSSADQYQDSRSRSARSPDISSGFRESRPREPSGESSREHRLRDSSVHSDSTASHGSPLSRPVPRKRDSPASSTPSQRRQAVYEGTWQPNYHEASDPTTPTQEMGDFFKPLKPSPTSHADGFYNPQQRPRESPSRRDPPVAVKTAAWSPGSASSSDARSLRSVRSQDELRRIREQMSRSAHSGSAALWGSPSQAGPESNTGTDDMSMLTLSSSRTSETSSRSAATDSPPRRRKGLDAVRSDDRGSIILDNYSDGWSRGTVTESLRFETFHRPQQQQQSFVQPSVVQDRPVKNGFLASEAQDVSPTAVSPDPFAAEVATSNTSTPTRVSARPAMNISVPARAEISKVDSSPEEDQQRSARTGSGPTYLGISDGSSSVTPSPSSINSSLYISESVSGTSRSQSSVSDAAASPELNVSFGELTDLQHMMPEYLTSNAGGSGSIEAPDWSKLYNERGTESSTKALFLPLPASSESDNRSVPTASPIPSTPRAMTGRSPPVVPSAATMATDDSYAPQEVASSRRRSSAASGISPTEVRSSGSFGATSQTTRRLSVTEPNPPSTPVSLAQARRPSAPQVDLGRAAQLEPSSAIAPQAAKSAPVIEPSALPASSFTSPLDGPTSESAKQTAPVDAVKNTYVPPGALSHTRKGAAVRDKLGKPRASRGPSAVGPRSVQSAEDSTDSCDEAASDIGSMLPATAWLELETALFRFRDPAGVPLDKGALIRNVLLPFLALEAETPNLNVNEGPYRSSKSRRALFFDWISHLLVELQHVQTSADRGAILESIACIIESRNLSMMALAEDASDEAKFNSTFNHILLYAIGELNKKGVYQNTLIFSGRLLAVAFFRVAGVASKLLRALPINRFALERVAIEAEWDTKAPRDFEQYADCFPLALRDYCFLDARAYLRLLDAQSSASEDSEDDRYLVRQGEVEVEMTGNWLRRWQSDDSELFFSFCRSYHRQLAGLMTSTKALRKRSKWFFGAPGYAHLATCIHLKCLSLVNRDILSVTTLSSQKNFNPGETANVLSGSTAGKPRHLEAANRRCTAIIVDIVRAPSGNNQVFLPMLGVHVKCLVKRTSLYDVQGVFCLLDWLDGVLGHMDAAELEVGKLIDIDFLITTIAQLLANADHALALMRTIAFCYSNFAVLIGTATHRRRFCQEILLDRAIFFKLFLSWSFTIRAYFLHLLVFRLGRINDFPPPAEDPKGRIALEAVKLFNVRLDEIRKRHDELSPPSPETSTASDGGPEGSGKDDDGTSSTYSRIRGRPASFVSTIKHTTSTDQADTGSSSAKAERILGIGRPDPILAGNTKTPATPVGEPRQKSKAAKWLKALSGKSSKGKASSKSANGANMRPVIPESPSITNIPRLKKPPVSEMDLDMDDSGTSSTDSEPGSTQSSRPNSIYDFGGATPRTGSSTNLSSYDPDSEVASKRSSKTSIPAPITAAPLPRSADHIAPDTTFDLQSSMHTAPPPPGTGNANHFAPGTILPEGSPSSSRQGSFSGAAGGGPPSPRRLSRGFSRRASILPGPAQDLLAEASESIEAVKEEEESDKGYPDKLHIYAVSGLREWEAVLVEHDEFFATMGNIQETPAVPRLPVQVCVEMWPLEMCYELQLTQNIFFPFSPFSFFSLILQWPVRFSLGNLLCSSGRQLTPIHLLSPNRLCGVLNDRYWIGRRRRRRERGLLSSPLGLFFSYVRRFCLCSLITHVIFFVFFIVHTVIKCSNIERLHSVSSFECDCSAVNSSRTEVARRLDSLGPQIRPGRIRLPEAIHKISS